jgi:hypothetical protein
MARIGGITVLRNVAPLVGYLVGANATASPRRRTSASAAFLCS